MDKKFDFMTDENIELLEKANKLFFKKHYNDSIIIYDKILKIDPKNLNVINNKGYALSKIKNYNNALSCYNEGLKINPNEKNLLINKISTLRKIGDFQNALDICQLILNKNPSENIVLYHKIRILHLMNKFHESNKICDKILELYPNNGDVLFDKSCNFALLGEDSNCLRSLEMAINISNKFKINARKNNKFKSLRANEDFLKLIQ